ncbi:SET domain-containing protein [Annulohypoxylon maeteangense]|uniref:SET domain-containing protein n=1 Tax=Annulohypoxylon maeteangense TaxID=1927788 RepID=UPI002008BC25|nr:SET domain-containing protein [Annulohypoxylon maeteangense]KAI0879791.1 SET domain-containing protein [Annulohypoxylon maeteangense]
MFLRNMCIRQLCAIGPIIFGSLCAASRGQIPAVVGQCPLDIPVALQSQYQLECPQPVDGDTARQPIDWSPWTHLPQCIYAEGPTATKYCVFTNSRHGNGGISMITTPETAADSIEILNDSGYTHTKSFADSDTDAAFEVIDIPGKGKGVIARRRINRAEAIMADWASMIVDLNFPTSVKRIRGYRLLHLAADQLSDPDLVLQLARSSSFSADIVEDVLRTNAFSYTLAGDSHMALYPKVSRINHACHPNAFIRFTPSSLAVSIVALRDIEPGEEINITYVPLGKTREERQTGLQKWGFNCTCSLCTASKAEIAASDYRRSKIRDIRQEVMKAVEAWDGTKAVKLTHEVLELMRAEDLAPLYASQYEIMARLYWKARDKKTGTEYAKKSIDTLVDQGYLDDNPAALTALLKAFDG